jgi:putative phosphoribosyl transferase
MFRDRQDAGRRLGEAMETCRGSGAIVLGIPRGGLAVAAEVARHLKLDFDVIIVRKLPYPDNPEAGFGAIAEDGSIVILPGKSDYLPTEAVAYIISQQRQNISRLTGILRHGRELPPLEGRTVIIVDDGIAMGGTMRAAVAMCRNKKAARIVVAAPVSGRDTAADMAGLADEVVILEKPQFFQAVAQVYQEWYDLSDREAVRLLEGHGSEAVTHQPRGAGIPGKHEDRDEPGKRHERG